MTAPGWYHGEGDPVGTVRYWDGQAWAGEPTTDVAHSDVVFYAAAPENAVLGAASANEQAVAAVTFKTTRREAPVVAGPPVAPVPQPAIPASAQLIAIGLCLLKAVPLLFSLLNTVLIAVFGTIGLQIAYNEDLEQLLALAIGMALLFFAIGTALLAAQASGAARNKPVRLLVPALIMTCWDGLLTAGAWTNDHGTDQFFYTGLFLLQGWVVVGAIIGLVKRTS